MPGEPPLVRMSNTFIEAGDATGRRFFRNAKTGSSLPASGAGRSIRDGACSSSMRNTGTSIENGERTRMVRDVSLSGEILKRSTGSSCAGRSGSCTRGIAGKAARVCR